MSGHESTVITGKLARDPELRYTGSGLAVIKLSIPVDRKVGEERKTCWWNITCFGKTAESAAENLHKGSLVRVEGLVGVDKETMTPRLYEKDEAMHSVLELAANSLTYLDNFGKSAAEKEDKTNGTTQDELPF